MLSAILASEEFALLSRLEDAIAAATRARVERRRLRRLPIPPAGHERLIEIPWVLSRYRGEARVLDVGYAFAPHTYLLALTELGARRLASSVLCAELRRSSKRGSVWRMASRLMSGGIPTDKEL